MGRDIDEYLILSVSTTFQPTRPHGARQPGVLRMLCSFSFNPRARMGRDILYRLTNNRRFSFNPRARMGRDNKD